MKRKSRLYKSIMTEDKKKEESLKKQKPISAKETTILKNKGCSTIAVGSAQRGIGSTHNSIVIANFLAGKKFKVAIKELNNNNDLQHLKNSDCDNLMNNAFRYRKVDYYPINSSPLSDILNSKYDYIIFDIGQLVTKYDDDIAIETTKYYEEMLRADVSILITGTKEWQLVKLAGLLKDNPYAYNWQLLMNFIDEKEFREYKEELDEYKCFLVPFTTEPFILTKEQEDIYSEILSAVLTKIKKKKKFNFFN